jgi:hypothetical protein
MTINEKLDELSLYIYRIFPHGVSTSRERKLVFKRFDKDLNILEINQILREYNREFTPHW